MDSNLEKRTEFFANMVETLDGLDVVNGIYHIICTYGIPSTADEEFLIASLMKVYLEHEEYERCSILQKGEFKRNVEFESIDDLTEETPLEDIKYLVLMGFFKSLPINKLRLL
jgi:hypothetical protein